MFKSKGRPEGARGRKRVPSEEKGDDEDDETANTIQSMKELQKERRGLRGIGNMPNFEEVPEEELEDEEQGGILDMGNKFAISGKATQGGSKKTVDKHLEAFLKDKLKKEEEEEESAVQKQDKMYELPQHLHRQSEADNEVDKMVWLTGLVEHQLDPKFKVQNIEDTEKAKERFLNGDAVDENKGTERIYRAFGNRFMQFNDGPKGGGKGKGQGATDDQVLDRFRKRFKR